MYVLLIALRMSELVMNSYRGWFKGLGIAYCGAFSAAVLPTLAFWGNCALAEIAADSTLLNNSSVRLEDKTFNITGGTQAGGNLFHSFQQFSVPTEGTAFFNNAVDIQNIISRVTGGSVSNIDGLIRANGSANLFLINPKGIIFGQNARLDVGGSFVASTASSLKFADSFEFSATNPQSAPLLTISVPIGLQFGSTSGAISVQGVSPQRENDYGLLLNRSEGLQVKPDKTLALVGNGLAVSGGIITTDGGRIELGSVAGEGLVNLTSVSKGFALGYDAVQNFAQIRLSQLSAVNARGAGGDIRVWGERVTLTDGSQIEVSTLGAEAGGTLVVNASKLLEVIGTSADGFSSALGTIVYPDAIGDGGLVVINTPELLIRDGAGVSTNTFGRGKGGNLIINANKVQLIGSSANNDIPSGLFTQAFPETGSAGSMTINTSELLIRDGAQVSTSSFGDKQGGNLTITANKVQLIGKADTQFPTGLFTSSQRNSTGAAGDLRINTQQLLVQNGAFVSVSSLGSGNAGELRVNANSITLDQGKLTATTASGQGGDINLQVQDLILMRNRSAITTTADNNGSGGNITINAPFIVAVPSENSDIRANAEFGSGGRIKINATGIYGLENRTQQRPSENISEINASSDFGLDGTIEINRPEIDLNTDLINLPAVPVDTKVATDCNSPNYAQSSFVITGRGGLPLNPREAFNSDTVRVDWVTLNRGSDNRRSQTVTIKPTTAIPEPIVEATGWVVNEKGEVVLTANPPAATPHGLWQKLADCSAIQSNK